MGQDVVAILKSADLATTVGWYRDAGFDIRRSEPALCEVSREGLALQFLSGETPWTGPPALTGCFYVHVHVPDVDVDVVAATVGGSITPEWGVEDRDWGSRELVLQDPNGYFITFTAPRR